MPELLADGAVDDEVDGGVEGEEEVVDLHQDEEHERDVEPETEGVLWTVDGSDIMAPTFHGRNWGSPNNRESLSMVTRNWTNSHKMKQRLSPVVQETKILQQPSTPRPGQATGLAVGL